MHFVVQVHAAVRWGKSWGRILRSSNSELPGVEVAVAPAAANTAAEAAEVAEVAGFVDVVAAAEAAGHAGLAGPAEVAEPPQVRLPEEIASAEGPEELGQMCELV